MADAPRANHEQHRVLTIRGRAYCNSDCLFCVEKQSVEHPNAPTNDQTRELIREGKGRFNMLFFANGEPSINPKLFDYVNFARDEGYRYFGMASHFRALADPRVAQRIIEAGFEYFDLSLHAGTLEDQLAVNPIGDGGESLREALVGVRNTLRLAERLKKRVNISHKVVLTRLNYQRLLPVFDVTFRLGVRHYIFQPVRVGGLEPALAAKLAVSEDEYLPFINDFLERTEATGARFKLYGMSRERLYPAATIEQESNVIRNVYGKGPVLPPPAQTEQVITPAPSVTGGVMRRITLRRPGREPVSFECGENEYVLSAALRRGYEVSYGCRMGSCAMCCGRLIEGQVDQHEQLALTQTQVTAGFALLCRSRPRSDLVVVADQEAELASREG